MLTKNKQKKLSEKCVDFSRRKRTNEAFGKFVIKHFSVATI